MTVVAVPMKKMEDSFFFLSLDVSRAWVGWDLIWLTGRVGSGSGWWVAVLRRGMRFLVLRIKGEWVVSRMGLVEG
jgi:hypothetical protein